MTQLMEIALAVTLKLAAGTFHPLALPAFGASVGLPAALVRSAAALAIGMGIAVAIAVARGTAGRNQ